MKKRRDSFLPTAESSLMLQKTIDICSAQENALQSSEALRGNAAQSVSAYGRVRSRDSRGRWTTETAATVGTDRTVGTTQRQPAQANQTRQRTVSSRLTLQR